ncbi:MAG: hypothetical protein WCE90_00630 [Candidatus Zixiibacteriota bacterium]
MNTKLTVCLLCMCLILFACGGNTPEPTRLNLSFSGVPPSSYDCNTQSVFQASFTPYNQPGLGGDYLKMFFQLRIGDTVFCESNDIDFPITASGDHDPYTLEFGGATEGKNLRPAYYLFGCLAQVVNGQFGERVWTDGRYITVTPKTSFSKKMHIEYDCQNTYGFSRTTFEKLASAFHIADTDTDFLYNELNLLPVDIPYDSLGIYHLIHWSHTPGYNMHLLAVQGLTNNTGSLAGYSTPGGSFGFTFIFVQDILDFNCIDPLYVIDKATIHELGHQRGGLRHASGPDNPHPEDHDSPFCVMNEDNSFSGNNDNNPNNDPPGLMRWFTTNPHFCPNCVNAIRSISW